MAAATNWPENLTVQDEMLTIRESAEISGLHERTIRSWVKSGKLPAARYRNTYVISKIVLAMTVAANRSGGQDYEFTDASGIESLLTETQVAKILGLSRQRVSQLVFSGKLPSISFGPRVTRISKVDLDRFIANRADGVAHAKPAIDLQTVVEVAEQLRVSPETIKTLIQHGELKAAKIGNGYRIHTSSVRSYLRRQSRHPGRSITASVEMLGSKTIVNRKAVKMRTCTSCSGEYPDRGYAEHLNDAEHIRTRWLRSGTTRL
jgi:excisionase family DNA binding protein